VGAAISVPSVPIVRTTGGGSTATGGAPDCACAGTPRQSETEEADRISNDRKATSGRRSNSRGFSRYRIKSLPMRTCGLPRRPVQPQSRPIAISRALYSTIGAEQVAAIDPVRDVGEFVRHPVGDDHVGLALEGGEVAHDARVEQQILFEQ